jgi:hypothetical protein
VVIAFMRSCGTPSLLFSRRVRCPANEPLLNKTRAAGPQIKTLLQTKRFGLFSSIQLSPRVNKEGWASKGGLLVRELSGVLFLGLLPLSPQVNKPPRDLMRLGDTSERKEKSIRELTLECFGNSRLINC